MISKNNKQLLKPNLNQGQDFKMLFKLFLFEMQLIAEIFFT